MELKLRWPHTLTAHFEKELRAHLGEAWISGHESLIPRMTNDEKYRHVVAAAVHREAAIILILNLRHFRPEHLAMWGVQVLHPQSLLIEILRQEPAVVMRTLEEQAGDRRPSLSQLLDILKGTVPDFVAIVSAAISRE